MSGRHGARPVMPPVRVRASWLNHAYQWARDWKDADFKTALTFRGWLRDTVTNVESADIDLLWEQWNEWVEGRHA